MEIPEFVVLRAIEFALRYSNMKNEAEIRSKVTAELESKARFIINFGGEITWRERNNVQGR